MDTNEKSELQTEFNRLVNRGIILGFVWILGAGSIIAIISGFQAKKIFKDSGSTLTGKEKIKNCFLIGIGGLLVWLIAIAIMIVFKKK